MTELIPFDAAKYLTSPEDQADLINDALASRDAGYIAHALGVVARARGMAKVARDTDLNRQQLYKMLTTDGNPTTATLMKVTEALGLRLVVEPV